MSEEEFKRASDFIRSPSLRKLGIPRDSLLLLYGTFKTANNGKNDTPKPSAFSVTERMKWNAWTDAAGKYSREEARVKYIALVKKLTNRSKL